MSPLSFGYSPSPFSSPLGPITFSLSEPPLPDPSSEQPRPPRRRFTLGVDVGQLTDFTALAVVERVADELRYECAHLQRLPLGTPYTEQVGEVASVYRRLCDLGQVRMFLDATGVGRALVDMFRRDGLVFKAVTLTGGNAIGEPRRGEISVPKRDLVATTKAMLQTGRLRVASRLPDAPVLVRELLAMDVTLSAAAHDSYGARSGDHDDLVLALSLALWGAEGCGRRRAQLVI